MFVRWHIIEIFKINNIFKVEDDDEVDVIRCECE